MQCPRCARTLPDDVRFCYHCGFQLATHESGAGGTSARAQSAGDPATDKVGVGAQAARIQAREAAQAISARADAGFAFQEFSSRGTPLPAPPSVPTPYLYTLPFPTPPAPTPVRPKQRGLSTGWIILCAMLAIVLLFTGLGIALYVVGSHALASDEAANNATKTAAMQLYQQITGTSPTDFDPLTNPATSSWSNSQQATYGCAIEHDGLHAHISDKGLLVYCLNGKGEFANVAFQVRMQIRSGDAGGLAFRLNPSTQQSYFIQVGLNGVYGIFVAKDQTKPVTNLARGVAQAMDSAPSATNTLTVIAKDSVFDFFINQQFVTQVQDTTFTNGVIGVIAADDTQSTEVLYSDALIWELD